MQHPPCRIPFTASVLRRDFLLIPVNEKEHWSLFVVCFIPLLSKQQSGDPNGSGLGAGAAEPSSVPAPLLDSGVDADASDGRPPSLASSSASRTGSGDARTVPCILHLNSVGNAKRLHVFQRIREYLQVGALPSADYSNQPAVAELCCAQTATAQTFTEH